MHFQEVCHCCNLCLRIVPYIIRDFKMRILWKSKYPNMFPCDWSLEELLLWSIILSSTIWWKKFENRTIRGRAIMVFWNCSLFMSFLAIEHKKGKNLKYFWNMFNECHQVDINLFQNNFGPIWSNNEINADSLFMSWDINREFLFLVQMIWNFV